MPNTLTLGTHRQRAKPFEAGLWAIGAMLATWLALVVVLGAGGNFVSPPGELPRPIAYGIAVPIVVFLVAMAMSRSVRDFAFGADLSLLTAIQAWRFAGFGFIALYAYGVLPGHFAWPAGLGDIAIGLTAPWMAAALIRHPAFAASRAFVIWNLLGILDLVVAVGTGAYGSIIATGAAGEITTRPMAELPLVLIPAYFVPIFVMLHVVALVQSRRMARQAVV
jgi:hypothetical protein